MKKLPNELKCMIHATYRFSPPRTLDFDENLAKIFNKGICLACTSSNREKLLKSLRFA